MEYKQIIREFNREADEKLQSYQNLLKKDNKEFYENLENQQQILGAETERIRKDIQLEASEREEGIEKVEQEMMS